MTFEPRDELTLGSKRLAKEACWRVLGLLNRRGFETLSEGENFRVAVPVHLAGGLLDLLAKIAAVLNVFRKQRLHPRVVEEMLEHRASGAVGLKTGVYHSPAGSFGTYQQSIHFPLYAARKASIIFTGLHELKNSLSKGL